MTFHLTNDKTLIPPLENGDQLTSLEFERRYAVMPNVKTDEYLTFIKNLES